MGWRLSAAPTGSPDTPACHRPRNSGRVSGNLRKPRRFHCGLLNAMQLSPLCSLKNCPAFKAYYARQHAEGKGHLLRQRLDISCESVGQREGIRKAIIP
ncbi:hypothetical protein [Streptantibioticus parmotrematis]|uniref:hypothetical protein n=1 Tax=Streptantibioticus parmotrematis TaxID=2873249 RepID=UPI0027DF717D|nr:hypothetical protein [Streptantibioticus parmotrematis]